MELIELLQMLSDEERNQKIAETLQAQVETVEALGVRVGVLETMNSIEMVLLCVLFGLIVFIALMVCGNERRTRKILDGFKENTKAISITDSKVL